MAPPMSRSPVCSWSRHWKKLARPLPAAIHPSFIQPVEFIFPDGESFKHYDMKWVDYDRMSVAVVDRPDYENRLREYTVKIFRAFNGNGYARCDFRLGADGELYMLEINPNCGIFYP